MEAKDTLKQNVGVLNTEGKMQEISMVAPSLNWNGLTSALSSDRGFWCVELALW